MGAAISIISPSWPAGIPARTRQEIRRVLRLGRDAAADELYVTIRHLELWKKELEAAGRTSGLDRVDAAIRAAEAFVALLGEWGSRA